MHQDDAFTCQNMKPPVSGGWASLLQSSWAPFSPRNYFYTLKLQFYFLVCFYRNQKPFPGLHPRQVSGNSCPYTRTFPIAEITYNGRRKQRRWVSPSHTLFGKNECWGWKTSELLNRTAQLFCCSLICLYKQLTRKWSDRSGAQCSVLPQKWMF